MLFHPRICQTLQKSCKIQTCIMKACQSYLAPELRITNYIFGYIYMAVSSLFHPRICQTRRKSCKIQTCIMKASHSYLAPELRITNYIFGDIYIYIYVAVSSLCVSQAPTDLSNSPEELQNTDLHNESVPILLGSRIEDRKFDFWDI